MAKVKRRTKIENTFEDLAIALTQFAGSTNGFIIALMLIIIWGALGPAFSFSEDWILFITTITKIITFLMVFLLQRAQNKNSLAIQLKLNELIASVKGASNALIDVEDLNERDLDLLKKHYQKLSKLFQDDSNIQQSLSIEDAIKRHNQKLPLNKRKHE